MTVAETGEIPPFSIRPGSALGCWEGERPRCFPLTDEIRWIPVRDIVVRVMARRRMDSLPIKNRILPRFNWTVVVPPVASNEKIEFCP